MIIISALLAYRTIQAFCTYGCWANWNIH